MSKLYIVGTPIGNLGDLSPRGVETLRQVDFIAAEDTRVSIKLLNHFGIKKPMTSYHEHNLRQRGEEITARIAGGESCAVITDAGMPCISDPGEDLIRLCAAAGIETVVVPGPSALISALALSGLATGRFAFEGFLSVQKNSRRTHLQEIKQDRHTLIFYEAPHKLRSTLEDLYQTLGDRKITLARELTKLHEEIIRTTLSGAVAHYQEHTPRGEFVLIIEGAPEIPPETISFAQALALVLERQAANIPLSQAAKEVSALSGYKKGELYKAALSASV